MRLGLREGLHESEVIEAWSKIVGEFIAAHLSFNRRFTTSLNKFPRSKSCESQNNASAQRRSATCASGSDESTTDYTDNTDEMIHEDLSHKIIGATMKVLNELKPGLDEKLYERAMIIELK